MINSATWIGGPRCGEEVDVGDDCEFYTASFHALGATVSDVVARQSGPSVVFKVPVEVNEFGLLVLRWCPTYSHLL
jgi:hypothetical protein